MNKKLITLCLMSLITSSLSFADCSGLYKNRIQKIEENRNFEETTPERTFSELSLLGGSVFYANKWAAAAAASNYAHYFVFNPKFVPVITAALSVSVVVDKIRVSEMVKERENHKDILQLLYQAERGYGLTLEAMQEELYQNGIEIKVETMASQISQLNDEKVFCPSTEQLATINGVKEQLIDMNL